MKLNYLNVSKSGRIFDAELVSLTRLQKCRVCGQNPPSDPAHIHSRGAGGGDRLEDGTPNIIALCRMHHAESHAHGWEYMVEKYGIPIDLSGIYPRLK